MTERQRKKCGFVANKGDVNAQKIAPTRQMNSTRAVASVRVHTLERACTGVHIHIQLVGFFFGLHTARENRKCRSMHGISYVC